jgi:hypothetical protein
VSNFHTPVAVAACVQIPRHYFRYSIEDGSSLPPRKTGGLET